MTKTMSIRMDKENYEFLSDLSKGEKGDLSKAVRDLVHRGRLMLAVERYKKEAPIFKKEYRIDEKGETTSSWMSEQEKR